MRGLLLACALASLALATDAKYCNKANYACVGDREFCLGNAQFQCAEGTVCTGSKGGRSPCTWPTSKAHCPGDFDDYACCSSKHYCLNGFQVACKAGTKCRGDGGSSGHPCRATKKRVVKKLPSEPKDPKNPKHHKWVPAEAETCSKGDTVCTTAHTYCDGGCEIKCPKGSVCKGTGPCVYETKCKDTNGLVPSCDGNMTCLTDSEYCHDNTAWRCPDGTKCTGSVGGKSPCTVEVAGFCPGAYDDFQCIDKNSYCLGGSVLKCATSTYCNPAIDGGDGNPCQPQEPTQPACTQTPYSCIDLDSYCAFGVAFDCPAESVCRGSAPCTTQPDEPCDLAEYECIDSRGFCFQGPETLRCPDGFKCVNSTGGTSNPCKEDLPPAQCPGPFEDDVCFDIGHYCLGGMAMECPANSFCVGKVEEDDEAPCLPTQPTNLTCTLPDMTCMDNSTYCSGSVHFLCPNTTLCTGLAPFPCVENAWCPAKHADDGKDDHKPPQHEPSTPNHPKPDCQEPECNKPDHPEPDHPEPACNEEDWKCRDKHEYCYKGEVLRCPHRTSCKGSQPGKHCCEVEEPKQRCAGSWADYQCCDIDSFCHGGFKTKCPEGTSCLGSDSGESPCKTPRDVVASKCPAGEYRCATDNSFCSGGKQFPCPGGTVCKGWAPCVYQSGDDNNPGSY